MKIIDIKVVPFRVHRRPFHNGKLLDKTEVRQTLTKVITDEGLEGYYFGGAGHGDMDGISPEQASILEGRLKNLVLGQDPFDREKIWHWMWTAHRIPENLMSILDLALWDLQARAFDIPLYKLLGGCRDRVKAYASTYPNMGSPQDYADHALECKNIGYTHYKIHPYYFWDPSTGQPDPGRPSHIKEDIEACRLIRDAVGDDMILSYDPWGTYRTYQEAYRVGRVLEELNFYWYEHPMPEYRVAPYKKLCNELSIPILSPEIIEGSIFSRADWILRGASDMTRIDVLRGGVTGVKKMAGIAEAYGIKCEIHMSGYANLQLLGSTSEDVCEFYERGLVAPGIDCNDTPPYMNSLGDPLDSDGYVKLPQHPGMGYDINWDYIESNKI